MTATPHLVSAAWLAAHLDAPDIAIVDASWHLPTAGRNAKAEFLQEHIPGAQFFDIDEISDTESALPHMLPSPEKFASRMRKMGIGDGKKVICYDTLGLYSAARAWWMFRVFGHEDAAVLDGGFPKWKAEGHPIEDGPPRKAQERHFTARYQAMMVRSLEEMKKTTAQIADARSPARFEGREPEPRAGLRGGHMPGAKNIHYASLLTPSGTLKPADELARIFADRGIDTSKPVVTSCGSGVTAAILSLALTILGTRDHSLYDGSWAEWGAAAGTPVAIGP